MEVDSRARRVSWPTLAPLLLSRVIVYCYGDVDDDEDDEDEDEDEEEEEGGIFV